jgi:hypothetical protein
MSLFGELLGYDERGNDIIGINQDEQYNCAVCGISVSAHTREMEAKCMSLLFAPKIAT